MENHIDKDGDKQTGDRNTENDKIERKFSLSLFLWQAHLNHVSSFFMFCNGWGNTKLLVMKVCQDNSS